MELAKENVSEVSKNAADDMQKYMQAGKLLFEDSYQSLTQKKGTPDTCGPNDAGKLLDLLRDSKTISKEPKDLEFPPLFGQGPRNEVIGDKSKENRSNNQPNSIESKRNEQILGSNNQPKQEQRELPNSKRFSN